jgi:hypothetical protein
MLRCLRVLAGVLLAVLYSMSSAASSSALPPGDPAPPASCVYTLSPPRLAQVSGVTMVTATLTPFPCTGSINPNSITVCLSAQGDDDNAKCAFEARPIPAQVYWSAYRPGTTYVSSGQGCGSVFTAEGSVCSSVAPKSATL